MESAGKIPGYAPFLFASRIIFPRKFLLFSLSFFSSRYLLTFLEHEEKRKKEKRRNGGGELTPRIYVIAARELVEDYS